MNKQQELAEQILDKHLSEYWKEHKKEVHLLIASAIAAIVEALNTPAKEEVRKYDMDSLRQEALRLDKEYLKANEAMKGSDSELIEFANNLSKQFIAPAKEEVVNIERKDLEENIRAFINRTCFSTTIQGRYGNWMSLQECLKSFGFELLSSIEKKLAAPAKEGITHVMIECPECETIQAAIIEHTVPFGTYIHHCENCKYIIMESEWNQVKPFKAPAKEVDKIFTKEDARFLLNNFQEYVKGHEIDPPYSFSTLVNMWIDDYTALNFQNAKEVEAISDSPDDIPKECTVCGVPKHLHGTCCGWTNASLIIDPIADVEKDWQRKWLEANNSELTINKNGTFITIK
jgi:hypothetical protein